jgi:hypothetical protein
MKATLEHGGFRLIPEDPLEACNQVFIIGSFFAGSNFGFVRKPACLGGWRYVRGISPH